jgi:NAD(P)-dependent dehydrogenase (short-subunit alcohol dehydrogenase family)
MISALQPEVVVERHDVQRVGIVTGGATGIGLAITRELASEGVHVVIASRDRERGEDAAASITREYCRSLYVETDATSAESINHMVERAVETFGGISILINNSGVEAAENLDGPSEEDWDRMFNTNTKGTWLTCRASIPYLLLARGVIVNNASMAGLVGVAGSVGYAASKAAVVSLTKSLALGYADRGLRVNAICPGPVDTDMTADEWHRAGGEEQGRKQAMSMCPVQRLAEPSEIAGLVGYLVSERASFITGAIVPIDGAKTSGLMPVERYRW